MLTGGYRVTPSEGIQVDENEVCISGDVNVFVPVHRVQTDEQYYVDSKQFVPERWNEKKEICTEGALFFPFVLGKFQYLLILKLTLLTCSLCVIIGPYSCPGKDLAMLSLRIFVTTLAQLYDSTFVPGEMGEAFEKETRDSFTTSYSGTVTNPVPATLTDNSQMFKTMTGRRISWEQYKGKQTCVEILA